MTPLIDIIFLLLLFFMLTSTFTRFAEVPLVQAAGGDVEGTENPTRLFIRLEETSASINGRSVAMPLETAVGEQLVNGEANGILSVSREVSSQRFIGVLTTLSGVEGLTVAVLR